MKLNIKLMISKDEIAILRSIDIKLRCYAIFALHYFRSTKNPTTNKLILNYGHKNNFWSARKLLKEFGLISETSYHVKSHARIINPVPISDDELGYDVKPEMDEYSKLLKLVSYKELDDIKRIKTVQNIDGIYFDNLEDLKIKKLNIIEEIKNLEEKKVEIEKNTKKIKKLKYNITAIDQVLSNEIKVYNWRKYNCQRLYSTFTNLPKEYRSNIRNDKGYFFEVDIKASQPRLVKKCLTEMMDNFSIFDYFYRVKSIKLPIIDRKSYATDEEQKEFDDWKIEVLDELEEFNKLTIDDFYMEVLGDYPNKTRDDMKKQFMWYFFDYHGKIRTGFFFNQYMYNKYSRINEFVKGLKLAQSFEPYKHALYSISSNLARCEVDLILKTIAKRFLIENPNSNIFTIHDSLNVNYCDLLKLIKIVKEEYNNANINLNYKIKDLKNNIILKENNIIDTNNKDIIVNNIYNKSSEEKERIVPYIVSPKQSLSEPTLNTRNKDIIVNNIYNKSSEEKERIVPYIVSPKQSLSEPTLNTRNKQSTIKIDSRGRFTISIKNKRYNSQKNETLDQFKNRIFSLTGLKV